MNKILLVALAGILMIRELLAVGAEMPADAGQTARDQNLATVRELDARRMEAYGGQPLFMVRPGLLADRTGRVVRVAAESLSLPANSPVEFALVAAASGKDYEAHAVSFATALDIHQALGFIGLTPGRGVNAGNLRFWPRGDRVAVTFHYQEQAGVKTLHVPAARLTLDTRTGKTLPEEGFAFTGSEWVEGPDPATARVYAADAFSPNSIISHYNEPSTVLDVPRRESQSASYSCKVPNPAFLLPSNQLIEVTFEPYYKDQEAHSFDFTLKVAPGVCTGGAEVAYTLQDKEGQSVVTNAPLAGVLDVLGRYAGVGREVYVSFLPEDTLSVASMQKVSRLLDKLDDGGGIRVEPPLPGHPYFRAFIPNEQHRKREERPALTAELILDSGAGGVTGTLVLLEMTWKGGNADPVFIETRRAISGTGELVPALLSKEEAPAVVLVFAPPSMTYGAMRRFVAPLLQRGTILYVFLK